jgi:transposase-like protein
MEAVEVEVRVIPVRCCPRTAPCPTCGMRGRRKQVLPPRRVRTIAYKQVVYLEITCAEYRARCGCCKTFRSSPEGVELGCHYDNRVREAVLNRILEDGMSIPRVLKALRRDFLLEVSEGFVYDCLHREVGRLNMAEYRRWAVEQFSGTLCVDELHLGRYALLLATDPLGDFPVAFALVDKNDQPHMRRFLARLKQSGLVPQVVITDGSNLYPAVLAELWPEAEHQLCIFHVIRDINEHVLDAVKRLRRELSRRGNRGRRRKRGRPSKTQRAYRKQRKKTLKEQAHFVLKHRYLIVTRKENLSAQQRKRLRKMFEYLPALKMLRTFVERVHRLFDWDQSEHQAYCRRAALVNHPASQQVPELAKALAMLKPEQFAKMIAFLKSPAAKRVRTNNHVERANRKLRYYEKVRYKWRRRKTILRFLILAVDCWWHEHPRYPQHPHGVTLECSRTKARSNFNPKCRKAVPKPHLQLSG